MVRVLKIVFRDPTWTSGPYKWYQSLKALKGDDFHQNRGTKTKEQRKYIIGLVLLRREPKRKEKNFVVGWTCGRKKQLKIRK